MSKKIDPEKELPKVQRMLYKFAHQFANKRFPFEESLTEVYWAYMECCRLYQPDRGMTFSSFVFYKVPHILRTLIKKKCKDAERLTLMEINDEILGASPLRRSLEEALADRADLLEEERELLRLLLDPPKNIPVMRYDWEDRREINEKELVKEIKEHIGFEKGVDGTYVDIALYNLRAKLEHRNLAFHE